MTQPNVDPTLDASASAAEAIRSGMGSAVRGMPSWTGDPIESAARREVVQGSGASLQTQTQSLLQQRLAAATLVLAAGLGVYLVRGFFVEYPMLVRAYQIALTAILAGSSLYLRRAPEVPTSNLRWLEIGLFYATALFFGIAQYVALSHATQLGERVLIVAAMKSTVLYVFGLIALYGMLIPNRWQRALRVVLPIGLMPVAVAALGHLTIPQMTTLARGVALAEIASDNLLMLVIGVFSSVYCTHLINKLRTEAYEARQLNQYRLTNCLGKGGMGEVFLAEHELLKRPCAVKLISEDKGRDQRAVERFAREVRSAARLSHWNSIEIFDYGKTPDGTFFYVMEYLPGRNLEEVVAHSGPMPAGRVIHFLHQVCGALEEAHASGLIHRDIKPSNIFAAYRGGLYDVAKLLDFGLVKLAERNKDVELTHVGDITGSPLYMSPEAASGETVDAHSDLYSLGAVAYFLLTGRPPFSGGNAMQIIVSHMRDTPPPPSETTPHVPSDLEAVILRCLEKPPENRFANARSLAAALESCESYRSWTVEEASDWWREFARGSEIDLTRKRSGR